MEKKQRKSVFEIQKKYLNPTWEGAYPSHIAGSLQNGFFPNSIPKEFNKRRIHGVCLKYVDNQVPVATVKDTVDSVVVVLPKKYTQGMLANHMNLQKSYVKKRT
jgi:hypothetical protein